MDLIWIMNVDAETKQLAQVDPATSASGIQCGKATESPVILSEPNAELNTRSRINNGYMTKNFSQRLHDGFCLLHMAYNDD